MTDEEIDQVCHLAVAGRGLAREVTNPDVPGFALVLASAINALPYPTPDMYIRALNHERRLTAGADPA